MMTIAVLMSVYKSESPVYFDKALQSVWENQTLKPTQIIIVQDGPVTDELAKVLSDWKSRLGSVLSLVVNEENLGLTKSLNRGIKYVKSELIARMDSDDISAPMRFELQEKYLREHPDVSVLGGAIQEFNSTCSCSKIRHYPKTKDKIQNYICKASPLAHPAVMMRTCIFEKVKYDERFRTSQDIALWFDVLCAGLNLANLDDIVLYFRREGDVYNRRGRAKAWGEFLIYMRGIKRYYGRFSWRYVYPLCRLCFRLLPTRFIKLIYDSEVRQKMLNSNG